MRFCLFLLLLLFNTSIGFAQDNFPHDWIGNWKGELQWFKGNEKVPKKVNMELRIHSTDTAGQFSWQIIYGDESTDNRPYTLLAKDTSKGHWLIDEHNGILLDQFRVGEKFCGTFTVSNATIFNSYWMEDGKLIAEFYSISAKPVANSGYGTDESPSVDSYKVNTYQRAVLIRQ